MSDDGMTLDEALADGTIIAWPTEYAVDNHPGADGPVCYLAAEPLQLGAPDGSTRRVGAGDLLSKVEVEHAGAGIARLVRSGRLVAVPADRGVVAIGAALFRRCDRLEQLVADLYGAAKAGQ